MFAPTKSVSGEPAGGVGFEYTLESRRRDADDRSAKNGNYSIKHHQSIYVNWH